MPLVRGLLLVAPLLAAGAAQAQVPGKPTDVVLKSVARPLDVSWTAPSGTVASYDVEYKKRADTDWTDAATDTTATTHSLTGLDASTPCLVRVPATNSSGDGEYSDNGSASAHPPAENLHFTECYQRIPADILPGQRLRLLTVRGSTSADVETYRAIARGADGYVVGNGADAATLGSQNYRKSIGRYRALVSTPGVDAREHTDTTWTATTRACRSTLRLRRVWLADNPLVRGAELPPPVWTDMPDATAGERRRVEAVGRP